MQAFALLGAHPELSLAEIKALTNASPAWRHEQLAIFDDLEGDLKKLGVRLGGTQKLGLVIGTVTSLNTAELATFLAQDLTSEYSEGKLHFGLSVYGSNEAQVAEVRESARRLGMTLKSTLKEAGRSARYVISKEPTLSAVVITSNHLLNKGAEYCLLVRENDIVVIRTVSVQNVDDWAHRDLKRPRRNAKQGMLPPKLARMMVNMTGLTEPANKTLYDPFCGSGTILMEGALVGFSKLVGSDINAQAVTDTAANLIWLKTQGYSVPEPLLFTASASVAGDNLDLVAESVDAIVTETYLGRPRRGDENAEEIEETINYVTRLYEESFTALKKVLKPSGIIVVASPIHVLDGKEYLVPVDEIMKKIGYSPLPLAPKELIYRQEKQLVGRKISRFKLSS